MKLLRRALVIVVLLFEAYFFWMAKEILYHTEICQKKIFLLWKYDCLIAAFPSLKHVWQQQIISMLHVDFIFILVYTFLLLLWSYLEMQQQRSTQLNELLRLNIFLGILAAVADCIENMILLHDFTSPIHAKYEPDVFSLIKWFFIGWILLVLVISLLRRYFVKQQ